MDSNQLSQLLTTLYTSTDNAAIQSASKVLNEWQQKPETWQQADSLLGTAGMQAEFYYFFAQTLKSKIQYDMYQLPATAYDSLRDSLVQKLLSLSTSSEARATRKQLCLAIADLVVQSAEVWPNSIPDLVNLLSVQHLPALLEILRLIPEEVENLKLMVESENRNRARFKCIEHYHSVLEFLNTTFRSGQSQDLIIECFLAWLKFDSPPAQYSVGDSPMLQYCLEQLSSISKDNLAIEDVVVDTLAEVLRACTDYRSNHNQHNPLVERKIFPAIYTLVSVLSVINIEAELRSGSAEIESVKSIARLLAMTGEGMMLKVANEYNLSTEEGRQVNQLVLVIIQLFSLPSVEVSETVLPFLEDFVKATAPALNAPKNPSAIHSKIFEAIVLRCAVTTEPSFDRSNPFDCVDSEYFYFRHSECLKLLYTVSRDFLGRSNALEQLVRGWIHQMTSSSDWAMQESFALCARDQIQISLADPSQSLREAMDFLIDQIGSWINVDSIHNCSLIEGFRTRSLVAVVGALAGWAVTQSQILKLIDISAQVLLRPVVAHRAIHAAAAYALRDLCLNQHCRRILVESQADVIQSIGRLFLQTVGHLPAKEHGVLTEGIVALVSAIPEDGLFVQVIGTMVLGPIVDAMNGADVASTGSTVDRATAVLRSLTRLERGTQRYTAIGDIITTRLWPSLASVMERFRSEEEFVEKSCRLLKHALRAVPEDYGKSLIVPIGQLLVRDFSQAQHSSYLYMAEVLAQEFGSDENVTQALGEMFDNLLGASTRVFETRLQSSSIIGQESAFDELTEDMFGMTERYLRYCPGIVIKSGSLPKALSLVVHAFAKAKRRETMEALSAFVEQLYSGSWTHGTNVKAYITPADVGRVRDMLIQLAPVLVTEIFTLIVQVCSRAISDVVPSVLMVINHFDPDSFRSNWIVRGLSVVPSSIMTDRDKQAAVLSLSQLEDERTVQKCMEDLMYRAKVVERRMNNSQ
jgi:transportin-3